MVAVAGGYGRIVWMPTHDSEHEVRYNKEQRPFVAVSRAGTLLPEVLEVIALVAQHDLTLATGHVTPEETLQILKAAKAAGCEAPHRHASAARSAVHVDVDRAAEGSRDSRRLHRAHRRGGDRGGRAEAARARRGERIGGSHFIVGSDAGLAGRANHTDTLALAASRCARQASPTPTSR